VIKPLEAPGPRLRPLAPHGMVVCPNCSRHFLGERWEASLRVCPACGAHTRVPAWLRAGQLADADSLDAVHLAIDDRDPLSFDDGIPYPDRVRDARIDVGVEEAVVVARANIEGLPVIIASMEFGFLGGSLGGAAGEAFARACELAAEERRGLVAVCVSGGARMQEGIASLAQMARCTAGVSTVAKARLPYVSILCDPCFGGVTASFATQADVILAEPRARIGFAGGRVIEQATHERLPEHFQTAEFLLSHGMVDAVVVRAELRPVIGRVLCAYGGGPHRDIS
jgi:acetyl-CoA carboxylase carboxyl transferase beta subunit